MKSFEYATPATVEAATGLLSSTWGETEVLAGGTDLITCLKQGIIAPNRVVSLRKIGELHSINVTADSVYVGAMTTLADFAAHSAVQEYFPSLVQAVHGIGSRQTIAVGTVGGDLCQRPRCWYYRTGHGLMATDDGNALVPAGDNRYHAIFGNDGDAFFVNPSSLAPALIALGGQIHIAGPDGERTAPLASLYRIPKSDSDRERTLSANEIVTGIDIRRSGMKNATYEVRSRAGLDWPYVAAAVAYGDGQAQVVLGHVAPVPWVAEAAASAVAGKSIDASTAAAAGEAAANGANPLSRNDYKVTLVKTAVKRALLRAAGLEEA